MTKHVFWMYIRVTRKGTLGEWDNLELNAIIKNRNCNMYWCGGMLYAKSGCVWCSY